MSEFLKGRISFHHLRFSRNPLFLFLLHLIGVISAIHFSQKLQAPCCVSSRKHSTRNISRYKQSLNLRFHIGEITGFLIHHYKGLSKSIGGLSAQLQQKAYQSKLKNPKWICQKKSSWRITSFLITTLIRWIWIFFVGWGENNCLFKKELSYPELKVLLSHWY